MNKSFFSIKLFAAATMLLAMASCSDDQLETGASENNGAYVSFNVGDAQAQARSLYAAGALTRAGVVSHLATQGLTLEDLAPKRINANTALDACFIETTVEGVNPVESKAQTRANITTTLTSNFSSFGYRGVTESSISTLSWFSNENTNADGTLVTPIPWEWTERYGRFYGISPQITTANSKLTLLPETNTSGKPHISFEVEPKVVDQVDLMTACSGTVTYSVRGTAPTTNLNFRHALTAVQFAVGQNLSWNKVIEKVEIQGAMSKGKYALADDATGAGAAWSDVSTPATFTLGGDGSLAVSTSEAVNTVIMGNTGDNYTFYMLPQTLNGVKLYVQFTDGTNITANLTGEWKAGTTKTYKISNRQSDWNYVLTATEPVAVTYTDAITGNYGITSYRQDPTTGVQQPVGWKVVGYDANGDGSFDLTEQPSWLTSLATTSGTGATTAQTGTAGLTVDETDFFSARTIALKNASSVGSVVDPYDLSTQGGKVSRSTANSYIISAPGYYKLPLVYGNAITKGAKNENSYKTSVTGNVLQNFVDHAGVAIDDPWITQTNGGANTPDAASIVWMDENSLVESTGITGSGENAYLTFYVSPANLRVGNAVVAATQNGTVVWSWHLWFTTPDALNTTTITNHAKKQYSFIGEALGNKDRVWKGSNFTAPRTVKVKVEQDVANGGVKQYAIVTITQNPGIKREGYAAFYQWGRKDALPGTDALADGKTYLTEFPMVPITEISHANMIKNPGRMFQRPSTTAWPTTVTQANLWSANNTKTTTLNGDPVVKTIYDPSPAGFKVPPSDVFTGFTTTGNPPTSTTIETRLEKVAPFDKGWTLWTDDAKSGIIFFGALGNRNEREGDIRQMGAYIYLLTATPAGTSDAGAALQSHRASFLTYSSYNRAVARSVRPIAE